MQYVCDVVFHRIRAHALKSRHFRIGESMPYRFCHAPFRRCKQIVIPRSTAGLFCWHGTHLIRQVADFPYPPLPVARAQAVIRDRRHLFDLHLQIQLRLSPARVSHPAQHR